MKLRNLQQFLSLNIEDSAMNKTLTSISHWVKILNQTDSFETSSEKDIATLEKLSALKVVSLKKRGGSAKASITKEGEELYIDFFKHGYYNEGIFKT